MIISLLYILHVSLLYEILRQILLQLRVSSVISNSPYILALDCDMYCNDPTSARQAMCFHLDPKISPTLAFVQFPQRFHNICKNDIYDAQLRSAYSVWKLKLSLCKYAYQSLQKSMKNGNFSLMIFLPVVVNVVWSRWAPGTCIVWHWLLYQEGVNMWKFHTWRFVENFIY